MGYFYHRAFLAYGTGSGIIGSITGTLDFLANVDANNTMIIVGVILIALVHTFVNIGLPALILPILKPFNKTLSYGYLSLGIASTNRGRHLAQFSCCCSFPWLMSM
ncbi:MAG: hypothetical protein R3A44_38050 [Caldilineaceae bacterium]